MTAQSENVAPRAAPPLDALLKGMVAHFAALPVGDEIGRELAEACRLPAAEAAVACGNVLLSAGFVKEAEETFRELARSHPRAPAGLVGLAQAAMRRRGWAEALKHWDSVLAAFPEIPNPVWRAARARVLIELGRGAEARLILEQLTRTSPAVSAGFVELAQLAMQERAWDAALDRWDDVLARFAGASARPLWESARASVLTELARLDEAETALRAIVKGHPRLLNPLWNLLHLLVRTGRHAQALELLEASEFRDAMLPAVFEMRCRVLIGLRRLAEARSVFAGALWEAESILALERLFAIAPSLYEGWPRTERWLALRDKVEALPAAEESDAASQIEMLRARLHLALRDYQGFLAAADRVEPHHSGRDGPILRAIAEAVRGTAPANSQKPKIFGIGLSKTGTTTLAAALTALGWQTLDWRNPLTLELMCEDDLPFFDAFTDTPVCLAFEKYYYQFPNSKFIYTTRPPTDWLISIERHWKLQFGLSEFAAIREAAVQPDRLHYGTAFRNLNRILYFNYADFLEAYHAHDRRVRRFFADKPKTRFLELDVFRGEGWSELCAFIGCDAPSRPFPWENRAIASASEPAARGASLAEARPI